MRISIFSKFDMAGGSEFRCVELANGIANYTGYESYLLSEKKIPRNLFSYIDEKVKVIEDCFFSPSCFYDSDYLLVVNTDAREFSTMDYWLGKSSRHNFCIDMSLLSNKTMAFLYNFIVSPSRNLCDFPADVNLKIITTNKKFYDEITKQDRYDKIRVIPRYILESPINPSLLKIRTRNPKDKFCFGMHSKRLDNKWNDEIYKLIKELNERYKKEEITFRFMGVKDSLRKKISSFKNVIALKEDEEMVSDFLDHLDVFLFFPEWSREEPWARVIAEAMVSGCPIIALNKGGTSDQVLAHNNGLLCKTYKDYYKSVVYLVEHPSMIEKMSINSLRISQNFYTENIIKKLLDILKD